MKMQGRPRAVAVRMLAVVGLAMPLASCQTWTTPFSEVTGERYVKTTLNTMPTSIYEIDGKRAYPLGTGRGYWLDPGRRVIRLTAVPPNPAWSGAMRLVDFTLDAEPCVRYYIGARFENPLGPEFVTYVDGSEPIEYCKTAETKK